ncbi:MAG: TraX family protein [Alphaproteobacteria bacterium]
MFTLALISMTVGHLYTLYPFIILKIFGRICFPIFAYGIAEGFRRTRSFSNYALRLWYLSLISQVPFYLYLEDTQLNICFTLLAGLFCIKILNLNIPKIVRYISVAAIAAIAQFCAFDSGAYGVALVLMFYLLRERKLALFIVMNILDVAFIILTHYYVITYHLSYAFPYQIQVFAIFALPVIFYQEKFSFLKITRPLSDKKKRLIKLFKYMYYPLHLAILYVIKVSFF